jgi:hypothetical protein
MTTAWQAEKGFEFHRDKIVKPLKENVLSHPIPGMKNKYLVITFKFPKKFGGKFVIN